MIGVSTDFIQKRLVALSSSSETDKQRIHLSKIEIYLHSKFMSFFVEKKM